MRAGSRTVATGGVAEDVKAGGHARPGGLGGGNSEDGRPGGGEAGYGGTGVGGGGRGGGGETSPRFREPFGGWGGDPAEETGPAHPPPRPRTLRAQGGRSPPQ